VLDRRRLLLAALLALAITGWAVLQPGTALAQLQGLTASPWFPLALLGLYLVRGVLGWPLSLLSALVGFEYGLVVGLPLALAGALGSTALTWALARHLPTEGALMGHLAAGGDSYFATAGDVRGVAAARLAPTPATAVSAAAGIAGVPLTRFLLGTLLGVLPWTVAGVALGASVDSVTAAGEVALDPLLLVGLTLGAALLLAGPAYRALRGHSSTGT
jgi:uncharacterized membrane protein YdjX (TVP38/TMEM64 family)